ncbi:zinc finger MIZ domain-containing protein 2 [Trichogramma pretiosum]|uniref:zinc finger MIZ domain-containing protein 2 n=1 Tax=Trichogramma pretiosum TaxID=7493 RepID=UPI0006C9852C|nr:zinc finger MIZ domain-containing protein 2 [Trichogramma pretiosum]
MPFQQQLQKQPQRAQPRPQMQTQQQCFTPQMLPNGPQLTQKQPIGQSCHTSPTSSFSLTPPSTPQTGGNAAAHISPQAEGKSYGGVVAEEPRICIPLREGLLMPAFKIEHNLTVSNHVFDLKQEQMSYLANLAKEVDVAIRCYKSDDLSLLCDWPRGVSVTVNAHIINYDMPAEWSNKPIFVPSKLLLPGRNTLQITLTACSCDFFQNHTFMVHMVHRPSIKNVVQNLKDHKRPETFNDIIANIKNLITITRKELGGYSKNTGRIKCSLNDRLTRKRIIIPVRTLDCDHIECFDLEPFLHFNLDRMNWSCPICFKSVSLDRVKICGYIGSVLQSQKTIHASEIEIDYDTNWYPVIANNNVNSNAPSIDVAKRDLGMKTGSPPVGHNQWQDSTPMSPYVNNEMPIVNQYNSVPMNQPMYGSPAHRGSSTPAQPCLTERPIPSNDPSSTELLANLPTPNTPGNTSGGSPHDMGTALDQTTQIDNDKETLQNMEDPLVLLPYLNMKLSPILPDIMELDRREKQDNGGYQLAGHQSNAIPSNTIQPDIPDLDTPPNSGRSNTADLNSTDDILALFE